MSTPHPAADPSRAALFGTYYSQLGLDVDVHPKTLELSFPSDDEVRAAWRETIAECHPMRFPVEESAEHEATYARVMEAANTLLDPHLCAQYQATLAGVPNSKGHESWLASPDRVVFDGEIIDWMVMLLEDSIKAALDVRGDFEDMLAARGAANLAGLPPYIPGERVSCIPDLDVLAIITDLVERDDGALVKLRMWLAAHPTGLAVTWRTKAQVSSDRVVLGKARKIGEAARARMAGPDGQKPHGEIELALDAWLMADETERRWLVHHELLHFDVANKKLRTVPHGIESFAEEIAAFGVQTQAQADFIAAALQHPATAERLDSFGVLDSGQIVLFRNFVEGAVALDRGAQGSHLKLATG